MMKNKKHIVYIIIAFLMGLIVFAKSIDISISLGKEKTEEIKK